jgi:type IV secretory pathway VirB4 component
MTDWFRWLLNKSNDNKLVYEVDEEWNYLTLFFYNNNIHKILLTFRLE